MDPDPLTIEIEMPLTLYKKLCDECDKCHKQDIVTVEQYVAWKLEKIYEDEQTTESGPVSAKKAGRRRTKKD